MHRESAVAPLNEAPARRQHVPDGEVKVVAAGEHEEVRLHQGFPEAATAHNEGAVVILERGRQGFGRARAVPIDEHDHGEVAELAVALGGVGRVHVPLPSVRPEHHGALGQELRGHFDRCDHIAAGIAAQVQHHPPHALALEVLESPMHFVGGGGPEILETHVPGRRIHHAHQGDGLRLQEISLQRDGERVWLEPRAALELEAELRAFLARHAKRELVDVEPRDGRVIHGDKAVAGEDAGARGGAARVDAEDGHRAVDFFERQAGDGQLTALQGVPTLKVGAREEEAMRIEGVQHAVDRRPHELRIGHGIHVVQADVVQDPREGLQLFVGGPLLGGQSDCRTDGQQDASRQSESSAEFPGVVWHRRSEWHSGSGRWRESGYTQPGRRSAC